MLEITPTGGIKYLRPLTLVQLVDWSPSLGHMLKAVVCKFKCTKGKPEKIAGKKYLLKFSIKFYVLELNNNFVAKKVYVNCVALIYQ